MRKPAPFNQPLLLLPQLHRRVWGGSRLPQVFSQPGTSTVGPEGEPVGEAWLASGNSVVAGGQFAGRTIAGLADQFGAQLVGTLPFGRYGGRLPLLAKFLDAAQPLSVQVHPDDAYALSQEAHTGHLGKSEAWLVLEAQPGAHVLWGLEPGVDANGLRRAATDGTVTALMNNVPVGRGSVVVNTAGTAHAVGTGIFLYEIQQASDLTYRIYDFGRLDAKGKPRELHLDKAVAVTDFSGSPFTAPEPVALEGGWLRLVSQPEFVLDQAVLGANMPAAGSSDTASLQLLTVVAGHATLQPVDAGWAPVEMGLGVTVLIPAAMNGGYELLGPGWVVRSLVPA